MYVLDILQNPELLTAIALFGVLAACQPFIETWILRVFADNPPALWSLEHLGIPLGRAALIVGFVYAAYPALFGLTDAPSITALLAADDAHASTLLGILYLIALLAPMLPIFYGLPEFLLPLQGMLATAFLFNWLTSYLLIPRISVWPGLDLACVIVLTSYLAHRLDRRMGNRFGDADQTHARGGYDALFTHIVTLQAQLPVILIYAAGLARRIAF
ncbi:MAG: hypothetical protein ACREXT_13890 [Gammaproteobacteria bacterium]